MRRILTIVAAITAPLIAPVALYLAHPAPATTKVATSIHVRTADVSLIPVTTTMTTAPPSTTTTTAEPVVRHLELPSRVSTRSTPVVAPVVDVPASGTTRCGGAVERWRPQVAQYNWPVNTMLQIMCGESGGDPTEWNHSGSGACGLFQLLPCPSGGLDGYANISYAYNEKYLPACKRGDCLSPWGR